MSLKQPRFFLKILLFTVVFFVVLFLIQIPDGSEHSLQQSQSTFSNITMQKLPTLDELKKVWIQRKIERLSTKFKDTRKNDVNHFESLKQPYERIHIFYYLWYRNVAEDQVSQHWSMNEIIDGNIAGLENMSSHKGPRICFYPREGLYSSRNLTIMKIHMAELKRSGIGVAVVHWRPSGFDDSPEEFLAQLMDIAGDYGIKVSLHVAPYYNWSVQHLTLQLKSFLESYGKHKALYTMKRGSQILPVFYIYDALVLGSESWAKFLAPDSSESLRNTKFDGIFIALLTEPRHKLEIKKSHFNGFYTYFARNGDTYGSSWKNWKSLSHFARSNALIFVPCVSPGYAEPLGGPLNKPRLKGHYFEVGMRAAMETNPDVIAITSFNGWEDGTQIEPAIPHRSQSYVYMDYEPHEPTYYLNLVGWWVRSWWDKQHAPDKV